MNIRSVVCGFCISLALALLLPLNAVAVEKYYGSALCAYEGFKCIKIQRGDTWEKLFPDKREREIVKRLNRTNMSLHHRPWIVMPTNLANIQNIDLSPFPDYIPPDGSKTIVVNMELQAFGAYDDNGYLVHWGPISGGKGWCGDVGKPCKTIMGDYRVLRKQGPGCISSKFPLNTNGGAPMPYCMHFYRAFALHGSTLPGYHASHGCVRLFFEDAKWLNKEFAGLGTKVIVTDSVDELDEVYQKS